MKNVILNSSLSFQIPSIILPGLRLSIYKLTIDTLGSFTEPTDSILIHSLVTSCFKDCNPLLFGLHHTNHKPLLVQNLATTRMPLFHHISPQSCSNPTGSRSNSEYNWTSFHILTQILSHLAVLLTCPSTRRRQGFSHSDCPNSGPLYHHPNNVTLALYCVFICYVVKVYL